MCLNVYVCVFVRMLRKENTHMHSERRAAAAVREATTLAISLLKECDVEAI